MNKSTISTLNRASLSLFAGLASTLLLTASAEEPDLAKAVQNPVGNLISVAIETTFDFGALDRWIQCREAYGGARLERPLHGAIPVPEVAHALLA